MDYILASHQMDYILESEVVELWTKNLEQLKFAVQ